MTEFSLETHNCPIKTAQYRPVVEAHVQDFDYSLLECPDTCSGSYKRPVKLGRFTIPFVSETVCPSYGDQKTVTATFE